MHRSVHKMSVSTIAGNGRAPQATGLHTLSYDGDPALSSLGGSPWGVLLHKDELYFSVENQGYIGRLRNGVIEHLVTGLESPMIFAIDNDDTIYIPEYGANRITIVTLDGPGRYTSSTGGRRTALEGVVKNPMSVRFCESQSGGSYYVVDTGRHRVLSWDPSTDEYEVIAGISDEPGYRGGRHDARHSNLFYPIDLDVNDEGEIVIADGMNNLLRFVDREGQMSSIVGSVKADNPRRPCLKAKSALDPCSNQWLGDGPARDISISWPFSPRFDIQGRIWFLDANNNLLRLYSRGKVKTIAGLKSLPYPLPQNKYYMTHKAESFGKDVGDGEPLSETILYRPMGLELVEYDDGTIDVIIADTDNQRIRLLTMR